LQQIDPEYIILEEEVLNLCILFLLNPLLLFLGLTCSSCQQQQDGSEPTTSTGEPFHFLPTAPDVLFCKGSPPMKKVIISVQPDLLQSASKRRQASAVVAPPPSLDQEKEDDHKASDQETSTSISESIRFQHQPSNSSSKTFFFILDIYALVDYNS